MTFVGLVVGTLSVAALAAVGVGGWWLWFHLIRWTCQHG
jgi:hypothetical protein